jgi:MATE family, multidrug efflux pump
MVGPFYGFFGAGLALYFASQGAGQLRWPIVAAVVRVAIAAIGGWLAVKYSGRIEFLFLAITAALAVFGAFNTAAPASGAWLEKRGAAPVIPQALGKAA